MEKKKSFGESLEAFFAGKGFYIVLFLCVAVIGVSAWVMLTENGTDVEDSGNLDMTLEEQEDFVTTSKTENNTVTETAATPTPAPAETPAPSAAPTTAEESVAIPSEPVQEAVNTAPDFFVWPLTGEIENGYSMTALQYNRTMQDWRTHDGLDIAADLGTQVKAVTSGTVTEVFDDDLFGTTVVISHRDGLSSTYSNLAATPTVKVGDNVVTGQVIGAVGDTALCETGEVTHLHFSMAQNGESVDPTGFMP